jgi:hypothetical protein
MTMQSNPNAPIGERVAVLEAKTDVALRKLDKLEETSEDTNKNVHSIMLAMAKYKGALGVVTLVAGGIAAVLFAAAQFLVQWVSTGRH